MYPSCSNRGCVAPRCLQRVVLRKKFVVSSSIFDLYVVSRGERLDDQASALVEPLD